MRRSARLLLAPLVALVLPSLPARAAAQEPDWTLAAGLSAGWATSRGQRIVPVLPRIELHYDEPRDWGHPYGALEGSGLIQFNPKGGQAWGASLLLGHSGPAVGPFVPYLEGGAGLLSVEMDRPRQADGLNFSLHVGAGLRVPFGERFALTAAYRFMHVSNADTREPNGGFDFQTALLGFTVRLDWASGARRGGARPARAGPARAGRRWPAREPAS